MSNITDMKKSELLTLCRERKLKGYSKKTRQELIETLMDVKAPTGIANTLPTTESVRNGGLDKFYTIPNVAEKCVNAVGIRYPWSEWGLVIEPSAGNGSFLSIIPTDKKIGIDIYPEHADIITQDYLTYNPQSEQKINGKILVIGNPPFGRVSSIAIKFFNHSAEFADVIAFIIPRTFRRVSVHNKLNLNFRMVSDEDIPMEPCSFNPPMMVKCCFQIWERSDNGRHIVKLSTTHNDWQFLSFGPKDEKHQPTPPIGADFAIRAYGGKCGEIMETSLENLRPKSWHWIKANIPIRKLITRFNSLDYSNSLNTARQNSMGRGDIVKIYNDTFH
jgi:predicted RNA methylase